MQFNLTLAAQEVEAILAGLQELPAKFSYGLIGKITQTVNEQAQAQQAEEQKQAAAPTGKAGKK